MSANEKAEKTRPQWWYVFLSDLRVRVSRFRFLKQFRYFLPFLLFILFFLQFFLMLLTTNDQILIEDFTTFSANWLFKIEVCITAFIIFIGFNSSLSYFAQNTEMSELEIISGSPISTRSYLFGKYMSLQTNNIFLTPILFIGHYQLSRMSGATINWWFLSFYFILITILFFSVSWLGITLGPKAVFNMKQQQEGKKDRRRMRTILLNLVVAIQFFVPLVLAFFLTPEQFELGFKFLPYGWFAEVGQAIYSTTTIDLIPTIFGLLTLLFSSIFVFVAFIRTNFSLNIENFESLMGDTGGKTRTPKAMKLIDKLPIPYKYSVRAFYLLDYRKNSFNRLVDYFFVLIGIGVIILGFVYPELDWSLYVFTGSLIAGLLLTAMASTEGLQILFNGKNTFLVCQSAPKGIRKLLYGKTIQVFMNYFIEFLVIAIVLLIFHTNKLNAILIAIMILCSIFSGLSIGIFSLSIAPFFETADITANPLRGLQIALPMNINFMATAGIVVLLVYLFHSIGYWLIFLILPFYFIGIALLFIYFAEKLLIRFQP
ncbi:MAG: hypothetical protein ACFFDW_07120 [Candidatus Thorarchaeota archaeon]